MELADVIYAIKGENSNVHYGNQSCVCVCIIKIKKGDRQCYIKPNKTDRQDTDNLTDILQ